MIKLTKVSKIYEKAWVKTQALNKIDLTIKDGEFVAIMGTSGCGKTTLLNIIGGMDTLSSGEYRCDNIQVEQLKKRELNIFRREHIGFVFQHFALMNHYTVFENVELPLLTKHLSKKERREQVMNALEVTGIRELASRLPAHLSGGQQQRCAIARALASDNPIILADEPTGALDSKTSAEILELFYMVNERGKTVVIVTHDHNVAEKANRIIELFDGKICGQK